MGPSELHTLATYCLHVLNIGCVQSGGGKGFTKEGRSVPINQAMCLLSGAVHNHQLAWRYGTHTIVVHRDVRIPRTTRPHDTFQVPSHITLLGFDDLIRATFRCGIGLVVHALNACRKNRGPRYTCSNILSARIRLRVFDPEGPTVPRVLSNTHDIETSQLEWLWANHTTKTLEVQLTLGNSQVDIRLLAGPAVYNIGLKHTTTLVYFNEGVYKATFHQLKPHHQIEILSCPRGHIIIWKQTRISGSLAAMFNSDGTLTKLGPYNTHTEVTFLPRTADVYAHVADHGHPFGKESLASFITNPDHVKSCIDENLKMLCFGSMSSSTQTAGIADMLEPTIQAKMKTGTNTNQIQFPFGSTSGNLYTEIPFYSHSVLCGTIMRIYKVLRNSQFRKIIDSHISHHTGKTPYPSFSTTKKIPGTGFPLDTPVSYGFFRTYFDIDLMRVRDAGSLAALTPVITELREKLNCPHMFDQTLDGSYAPYGTSVSDIFRQVRFRELQDAIRHYFENISC